MSRATEAVAATTGEFPPGGVVPEDYIFEGAGVDGADEREAVEAKLEELMGLRDAVLVCAAAMTARLAALKQEAGTERGRGEAK